MNHKKKGNAKRFFGILLAASMVLSMMPESGLTLNVYAEETDAGLCEHHRSHTADCYGGEYKMSRPNVQKILYKNVQLVCLKCSFNLYDLPDIGITCE